MKLPNIVSAALNSDPALNSIVNAAIAASKPIVSERPEFFPEYTDHSSQHNDDVLRTAITILTSEAISVFTANDFAALSLAILLHDCGMHLSGDGFSAIISPSNSRRTFLDTLTWHELWNSFLFDAARFDGRQLRKIFGSTDPVKPPPKDSAEYTKRDRLLIGEFLRRHHPRLAHEISVFGFPGLDGTVLQIIPAGGGDIAEISGLIARSHGMSLRNAIDIFASRYHEREYQGIHAPILMAAVRIADFLQIQPERAPETLLKIHKLKSPFSEGEWRVHQSVRNITPADADPEAIFVDAKPNSVETFLKFKSWAANFQSELDSTWAALGEVYGRFGDQGFDKFKLKLRRLRTSVDDEEKFAATAPFVPAKIAFEASSPDLLSLLVAPLYGNRPEIGLRELIQNSVDAVIERKHIEGAAPNTPIDGYDVDIIVYPIYDKDKISQVVISDRGIGMNSDIVQNYFLRAGASFRRSFYWKKSFMSSDGKSSIARTGRFGIGALAGFLLGAKMHVRTRRFDSAAGLEFIAEIDREFIEVKKCECNIGTKIVIQLDKIKATTVERMFSEWDHGYSWDWYCGEYPKLLRLNKIKSEITPRFLRDKNEKWTPVEVGGYESVLWADNQISTGDSHKENHTYCNNILTFRSSANYRSVIQSDQLSVNIKISAPTILISDRDGRLPLNLQRDDLTEPDPELSNRLRDSIARDLLAQAIAIAPDQSPFTEEGRIQLKSRRLSCYLTGGVQSHWCWECNGWKIADFGVVAKSQKVLVFYDDFDLSTLEKDYFSRENISLFWRWPDASVGSYTRISAFFREIFESEKWGNYCEPGQGVIRRNPSGVYKDRMLVFSDAVLKKIDNTKLRKNIRNILNFGLKEFGSLKCLSTFESIEPPMVNHMAILQDQKKDFCFSFIGRESSPKLEDEHIFPSIWQEFLGAASIPVNFDERRASFPKAFELLGARIEYYRKALISGQKK